MPPRSRAPRRDPRAPGTGGISADRGAWRARIRVPTRDGGYEVLRQRFAEYHEAVEWLDAIVAERLGSGVLPDRSVLDEVPTWEDYATGLIPRRRSRDGRAISPKTARIYADATSRMAEQIGTVRLDHLRRRDTQRLVAWLNTPAAGRRGRVLSWESQHIHWRWLRTTLTAAVRDGLIARSPLHPEDAPVRATTARRVQARERAIPDGHLAAILDTLAQPAWECSAQNHAASRCRALWLLRLALGVRQGEALALHVGDVERAGAAGVLRLRRHLERVPWVHGCATEPCGRRTADRCPARTGGGGLAALDGLKGNRDGERALHLDTALMDALRAHIDALPARVAGGPLFPRDGLSGYISPEWDRATWGALLHEACGEGVHYRVHDLRHTVLTYTALTHGVTAATVLAGHSDVRVTQASYVHPDATATAAAVASSTDRLAALALVGQAQRVDAEVGAATAAALDEAAAAFEAEMDARRAMG